MIKILLKPKALLPFLSFLWLSLSALSVHGQIVSGIVRSSADNQPLTGVTVQLAGTKRATITDSKGYYTLSDVISSGSLYFSSMGYQTDTIPINGQPTVNASLQPTSSALDQVVVVGYGTQKKENLTGSVATITAKELATVPTPNVSTLFYGRLPGLVPVQRSGAPGGDDVGLSIRGFSSALVVVDGIQGRDFSRLDPNEIESVTVLKDAASAAVYGVSGGNGVILVTTKKGLTQKPELTYTMNYGIQRITRYPEGVNSEEFAILRNQAAVNLGGQPIYTQEEVQKFRDGTDPRYPDFDYQDYFLRPTAPQMQQNLSVRGGSEKIKYFFLLGQASQASIFRGGNQEYTKYNFRSNVSAAITKDLELSINIGGRIENRDNMVQDTYLMSAWLYYQSPIYNPKNPDGTIASTNYGLSAYLDRDLSGYSKNKLNVFEGLLSLKYTVPFIKGLSLNITGSNDLRFNETKFWEKKFGLFAWDEATKTSTQVNTRGISQLIMASGTSSAARIQSSINYEKTFTQKHNVKLLLLNEVSESENASISASRQDFIVPIDQMFAGPDLNKNNSGSAANDGRNSYVGRLNYDYLGKYLLEYSFRYDGSARFPPRKRWGYFSGASIGWRISEENFIKNNLPAIDDLKLRASYGQLGNDNTGQFQFLAGYVFPSRSYVLGGNAASNGLVESSTPNPNITWEESNIYNLGINLSLWKGRLQFDGDVFYQFRNGLLATRATQLPSTYGASLPAENLNSLDARGFEIALRHNSRVGNLDVRVSTNLSYSRLKNRHLEQRAFTSQFDEWRNNNKDRWGSVYFGYKSIGQFQSQQEIYSSPIQDGNGNSTLRPGDIKYEDFNHDGVIDGMDNQVIARGYGTGLDFESSPLLNFGFGLNVTWKRLTVDMMWQGASMFDMLSNYNAIAPFVDGRSANKYLMDNWHRADPTDPNSEWVPGKYPSAVVGGSANNTQNSSFWIKDGTYLRLKSLSISYNLKSDVLSKRGIRGLDVTLSGQNLLTFSGLGDVDPENRNASTSYYPQMMTINAGLRLIF
jgi:TonB-linked SusC/RagA family outer membrane protein